MNIANQTVVLTGATGGIGEAISQLLVAKGASLLLVARNGQSLGALSETLVHGPDRVCQWISADITTEDGRAAVLAKAKAMGATVLINNAGSSQFERFEQTSEADFRRLTELNLLAPIFLTQGFLKILNPADKKVVVNVGSALGSIGFPYYTNYCATKFGLRGFTEALQRELADSHHNVLYFAPRATQTAMNSDAANAMNTKLGNAVDSPLVVAQALVAQLESGRARRWVGWPEKLFARLNGLLPELVDGALAKKLKHMSAFVKPNTRA